MVAFKASLSSEHVFTRPEGFPLVQNDRDLSLTLLGQTDHSPRAVVFPPRHFWGTLTPPPINMTP
eukprot:scaffold31160_cov73-Cyclotella_meneghiniana.AAC.5